MGSREQTELIIRATCHFESGHVARLPVADLSEEGAFLCSVRPPAIGARVHITLQVDADRPVAGLEARVVGVRLDPASAERSGFELRFAEMPDRQHQRLRALIERLANRGLTPPPSEQPSVAERRAQPRVDVDFLAEIPLPSGIASFRMLNLSMSGALLVIEKKKKKKLHSAVVQNAELPIQVISQDVGDPLPLTCVVVRVDDGASDGPTVAVRFIRMDDDQEAMLESLMLYSMIQKGFPAYPYAPD
jgi:c-di-GMP-binding flagellar brake protein YcgR